MSSNETYLIHYGRVGMKWGIRNKQVYTSSTKKTITGLSAVPISALMVTLGL